MLHGGLVLAKDSVAPPTQRSYNSTWTKWRVFMHTCHHNPTADYIGCTQTSHDQLLQLLLMFVSYCVDIIQKAPTSIPVILSALRYQLTIRCVSSKVTAAFDHDLLVTDPTNRNAFALHVWDDTAYRKAEHSTRFHLGQFNARNRRFHGLPSLPPRE